jgi:hypothetical protein
MKNKHSDDTNQLMDFITRQKLFESKTDASTISKKMDSELGRLRTSIHLLDYEIHDIEKYPEQKDFRVFQLGKRIAEIKKITKEIYEMSLSLETSL